jgi:hypothetical protein
MNRHAVYDVWAPPGAAWSAWVKPVLFAHLPPAPLDPPPGYAAHWSSHPAPDATTELTPAPPPAPPWLPAWVPPAGERWAVVVEAPGAEAVALGLTLAAAGYRPVPLFNALPAPPPSPLDPSFPLPIPAAVNVEPILAALVEGADRLRALALPADAPPAFLVDAARQPAWVAPGPGWFDNRSVHFRTDFPSADILKARGVGRALFVCEQPRAVGWDLTDVLAGWQKGGIALFRRNVGDVEPPAPWAARGPGWLGWLWRRLMVALSFRPHPLGGFGGVVTAGG